MFESNRKKLEWRFDIFSIILGLLAMSILILSDGEGWMAILSMALAGILGLVYAGMFIYLWWRRRIVFDRYLVQNNYLMKVVCVVLLMPITMTLLWYFASSMTSNVVFDSAKTMSENRIVCGNVQDDMVETPSAFWTVYYHFIDPGNQHMVTGSKERLLVAMIAILGVFLMNGLLVSSVVGWIDRRKELWRKGEVKYSKKQLGKRGHYVIIGSNDGIYGIVRTIFKVDERKRHHHSSDYPYLIIQTSRDVESFRRELFSELDEDLHRYIIIYYGNRTSEGDLDVLLLKQAKEVYVLGENVGDDDTESYHDTMNMVCVKNIGKNIADHTPFYFDKEKNEDRRLVCRVMFEYQATFNVLQTTDVNNDRIKFCPFNYYEMWAQKVLVRQELMEKKENGWVALKHFEEVSERNINGYVPIEGYDGIKSHDESFVHFVVVGMSRIGVALAIEAAHLAHYPNFGKKRTRITFIDSSMEREMNFFKGRFKELFSIARQRYVNRMEKDIYSDTSEFPWKSPLTDNDSGTEYDAACLGGDFLDIEWEFINGTVESPCVQEYFIHAAQNKDAKLTIAVCLPNNSQAVAAAAYIDDKVYASKSLLQVLVYQRLNSELVRQINENKRYNRRLKAFGMASEFYDNSLLDVVNHIGKDLNEAYSKCRNGQVDEMMNRMKKIEVDGTTNLAVVKELCPSFAELDKEKRRYVIETWKNWIKENGSCDDKWKERKNEVHLKIEHELGIEREKIEGKSSAAKMWSNHYNVNAMWTKFRCVGGPESEPFNPLTGCVFDSTMLDELARTEHNRWCTEQLLMRFRPLKPYEQSKAQMPKLLSSDIDKEDLKTRFAHLDICSNDVLHSIDCNASESDYKLTQILPEKYKSYIEGQCKGNA